MWLQLPGGSSSFSSRSAAAKKIFRHSAFFVCLYACKMLGDYDYVSPALAAWGPVLAFGPHSPALFDAVHT